MDVQKILTDCETLENTISVLIRDNSGKENELVQLQENVFQYTKNHLESLVEKERDLQCKLDEVITRRQNIENEIKQYTTINEKLSELVSIAQKRNSQDIDDDALVAVVEANEEYLHVKSNYAKARDKLKDLQESATRDIRDVQILIRDNAEILVALQRNDNIIRLLEQQLKYSEQQFDLVLNELPWEPLTKQYIEELLKSPNQLIKDLAGTLQIQANELEDLNDSLNFKKKKKLEALEGLLAELSCFIQKRDEAVIVTRLNN